MQKKLKIFIPIIIICVCVLVEALISSFPYFAFVAGRRGESSEHFFGSCEKISDNSSKCSVYFEPTVLNSVSFSVRPCGQSEGGFFTEVKIYASTESDPNSFREVTAKKIGIDIYLQRKTVYIAPEYKSSGILLEFSDMRNEFEVYDITVNPEYIFNMNYLRLAFLIAASMLMYCVKEYRQFFRSFRFRNVAIITAVVCAFGSALFSGICATADGANQIDYSNGIDILKQNPYVQQFDAFEKGQLYLDIEPDPALEELENPYDPYSRSETHSLWDRAYKDGKYYSYFGTAPIFTVYYPHYFVTGKLPAESTVTAIFALIVSVFLPLAVMLLSRLINSSISPWFASLTAFGALGASMVYLLQRGYSPFYYFASISALAFASATVFWGLLACLCRKKAFRILSFVASGISFALCIHSRLNTAFSLGIVIATALIAYFVKSLKSRNIKDFVTNTIAFCVPVGIGIVLAMWYNYARFSNPFDFGTAYQLTVADTSEYTISLSGLFPMLYHYFFRQFQLTAEFPFFNIDVDPIIDSGKYIYTDSNIGIFAMPFMLAIFLSYYVFRSKSVSKQRKAILASALASLLITAFVDTCLGGIIFRYTADITLVGVLASAGIIFQLYSICVCENRLETKGLIVKASSALCTANVIVTAFSMLMLNGNLRYYLPSIYEFLRNFVMFWK